MPRPYPPGQVAVPIRRAYPRGVRFFLLLWMTLFVALGPVAARAATPDAARVGLELPADWIVESTSVATVHGALTDAATVRRLAEHAAVAVPKLSERLGVPAGAPIDIVVAPDTASFGSLQPGHTPDWADGTAWPNLGLVFLHAPSARRGDAPRLEQVLDHEIVHILVGRAFGGRPVPRWLQEGLAQFYAGELGPQTAEVLTRAAGTGSLLPLRQISAGFPADSNGAQLAYAQTADFTAFLAQRAGGGESGDAVLRKLLAAGQRGALLSDAVYASTGQSLELTESQWQARWGSPWVRADGLAQSGIPAVAATALLAVGVYRRRRRYHAELERLEAEDRRIDERRAYNRWLAARRAARRQDLMNRVPDGYAWSHPVAER